MRHHNISTLTGEIYDTLFRNTNNGHFYVDETAGCIYIEYQDKTFKITISEENK